VQDESQAVEFITVPIVPIILFSQVLSSQLSMCIILYMYFIVWISLHYYFKSIINNTFKSHR